MDVYCPHSGKRTEYGMMGSLGKHTIFACDECKVKMIESFPSKMVRNKFREMFGVELEV